MSKKSYLTHGIVVATAITMVFFEVLPLTSWIATVKEMQNENRVYANQEYDDHIVSPIAITGRSTILYMKTPLPLTKKNNSDNSKLRIDKDVLKALDQDAKRRGISVNSLVNNVLKNYVTSDQYFEELGKKLSGRYKIEETARGIEEQKGDFTVAIRTRILENQHEMIKEIKRKNNAANKLSICTGFGGMQMSYNYLFDSYKNVVDKYRKKEEGEGYGLRWITLIHKDSLSLVKIFLKAGIQIRHIKSMPPLSFGVSDKEVAITIDNMMGGKMSQSFLISNEPLYVNHFNSLFEQLWKDGIYAEERIKDIELGVDLAEIEVIPSSAKAQEIYLNMVKDAKEEVILVFPSTKAFIRQGKIGAIKLAKQAAQKHNVKVRILMPAHKSKEQILQKLKGQHQNIDIRYIKQMSETKATILVVDRRASLVMEVRDDSKTTFVEAIGLSTYSNSKAGVLSYVAIFENLWRQTELYQQVKNSNEQLISANEQLKVNDKMQKEFINVAAHELRTPVQPILGLSDVLISKKGDIEQYRELLDAIKRSAKRLQKLTEDILDVTKIESQSLQLRKQRINLNEVILGVIAEYAGQIKNVNNVDLRFISKDDDVFVEADRLRLSQVFDNILNNAIKFTKEGSITIAVQTNEEEYGDGRGNHNNNDGHVVVDIKDTGTGIDPEILPRLFTKFATKSVTGTGLGLFISKSIIESHSGKIWAENNADGRGSTFYVSLWLSKK
jgi:two-component system, OmpR family, sensor histidine kinase VicK